MQPVAARLDALHLRQHMHALEQLLLNNLHAQRVHAAAVLRTPSPCSEAFGQRRRLLTGAGGTSSSACRLGPAGAYGSCASTGAAGEAPPGRVGAGAADITRASLPRRASPCRS